MPTLEEIRTITIKAQQQGVPETSAALNKLAAAQSGVAVASDTSTKSTLSMQSAFDRQQRSLDASFRSSQSYAKAVSDLDRAHAQGLSSIARHNELMAMAAQKYGQGSTFGNAFTKTLSGVTGSLIAMSAGAGPVGVFLSALGTWGTAAAVGLGAARSGFEFFNAEATRMGEHALAVRNFADSTGFAIAEIKALKLAGGELGIEGDRIQAWAERFAISLDDVRKGIGPVADRIHAINPDLLIQIERTRSNAAAWDLMAKAADGAGMSVQKFLREVAGRNSAQLGLVFAATEEAGGLSALTSQRASSTDGTDAQVREWAKLTAEIDEAKKRADNYFASIFTSDMLHRQEQSTALWLQTATYIKDMSRDSGTLTRAVLAAGGYLFNLLPNEIIKPVLDDVAASRVKGGFTTGLPLGPAAPFPTPADFGVKQGPALGPLTAEQSYNNMKRTNDAIGVAATAYDHLQLSLIKVDAEMSEQEKKLTAEQGARVKSVLWLQFHAQQSQALVGVLGPLATVEQQVQAAQDKLNVEMAAKSLPLTQAMRQEIDNVGRAHIEWNRLTQQAGVGVFNLDLALTAAGDELRSWIAGKLLDPNNAGQLAAAYAVLAEKIRATADQAALAATPFKQLKQLQLDGANTFKAFDQFGASSLNNFTDSLAGVVVVTKTAKQAFADMTTAILTDLAKLLIRQSITGPLAGALSGFFNPSAPVNIVGANGPFQTPTFHAGGILGLDGGASRYIHPAYFDDAKRFAGGGIMGLGPDEIPIIGHRNEEVIRRDDPRHRWNGGGGAAPVVNLNITNTANADVTSSGVSSNGSGGFNLDLAITQKINKTIAQGGADASMRARFGIITQPRPR